MKPVEVTDERFARRLEEYERWRKEHPVRRKLVDALDRIICLLRLMRNALRW
jgi:hypothetical protein